MEGSLADELYSEILQLSNVELGPTLTANSKQHDSNDINGDQVWNEEESSWDDSIEEPNKASDLDREWQRRRNQFHTIGYRDGLMAGKEASAQEGFNVGFRESVLAGYNWGVVRGVTSALAYLPNGLKERLVQTHEKRNKFQHLYESVHSLSSTDTLKLFHDNLTKQSENAESHSCKRDLHDQTANSSSTIDTLKLVHDNLTKQTENAESSSCTADLHDQSSDGNLLGNYYGNFKSLILESPAIQVHLEMGN